MTHKHGNGNELYTQYTKSDKQFATPTIEVDGFHSPRDRIAKQRSRQTVLFSFVQVQHILRLFHRFVNVSSAVTSFRCFVFGCDDANACQHQLTV